MASITTGRHRTKTVLTALIAALLALAGVGLTPAPAHAGTVTTVLGRTAGDPVAITVDKDGNVYTANSFGKLGMDAGDTVTKITADGESTTLGATGSEPQGIALDEDGNVYTANSQSNNVTKITPKGVATTLGSTGSVPNAIAVDKDGNVYTANGGDNTVTKITPQGIATTFATTSRPPSGITVDKDGNVYTATEDTSSAGTIIKITPAGVTSVFGATVAKPRDPQLDDAGNVYATGAKGAITKTAPGGATTCITGCNDDDGNRGTTLFVVDGDGNVYAIHDPDSGSYRSLVKISPDGTENALTGYIISKASAISRDAAGYVYIASRYYEVLKVDPRLTRVTFDANGGSGTMPDQLVYTQTWLYASKFSRPGYALLNWNSKPDGTGTAYYPHQVHYFDQAEVTLYAQWVPVPSVTNVTATADPDVGTATVSWDTSGPFDNRLWIESWVSTTPTSNGCSFSPDQTSCQVRGLKAGKTYTFTVHYVVFSWWGDSYYQPIGEASSPPVPMPAKAIRRPGISINNGEPYTNSRDVTVQVGWPEWVQKMELSNDGGFAKSTIVPVANTRSWRLSDGYAGTATKVVYARFLGPGADEDRIYSDDIIFDNTPPVVSTATGTTTGARSAASDTARAAKTRTWTITTKAKDNRSGVRTIQVNTRKSAAKAVTRTYTSRVKVALPKASNTVYVRVQDGAKNWSAWKPVTRK